MRNSKWTHVPSPVEHGGTEFDSGWRECYDTKVAGLYEAIENAIIDMKAGQREPESVIFDLQQALKQCDKR